MWLLYCIFGIHFCLFTSADNQLGPVISYITQETNKNVGESVELECSVKNVQPGELSWVRNSFKNKHSLPISTGTTVLANDTDHYYASYNEDNLTYTLKIRDLQEEDAGIYKCVIAKSDFRITVETKLQVIKSSVTSENSSRQLAPAITYITQNMIKNLGESVELMCSVKDVRPGELLWVRESFKSKLLFTISTGTTVYRTTEDTDHYYVSYNEDNSLYTLKIRNLKEEDAGIYRCKIIKPGFSTQAETSLQVN